MDTITAEQRADLVARFRDEGALAIADAVAQCGIDHGSDCETCASIYELEFDAYT